MEVVIGVLLFIIVGLSYGFWATLRIISDESKQVIELQNKLSDISEQNDCYREVVAFRLGGVGKRIAECRDITESIFAKRPELFDEVPGLIYWLQATDSFLVHLHSCGVVSETQDRIARSRSSDIYELVSESLKETKAS